MKLETSGGKTFDIKVICTSLRSHNKVLIELEDSRALEDIAKDFDGIETMRTYEVEGIYQMYEGFSKLVGLQRMDSNTVRLTLERVMQNE